MAGFSAAMSHSEGRASQSSVSRSASDGTGLPWRMAIGSPRSITVVMTREALIFLRPFRYLVREIRDRRVLGRRTLANCRPGEHR